MERITFGGGRWKVENSEKYVASFENISLRNVIGYPSSQ